MIGWYVEYPERLRGKAAQSRKEQGKKGTKNWKQKTEQNDLHTMQKRKEEEKLKTRVMVIMLTERSHRAKTEKES